MGEHTIDFALETTAVPAPILLGVDVPETLEAMLPIGIEGSGDDRGVVGPVLEQVGAVLDQAAKLSRPVGLVAGRQDHVMGALDHLDAVDLNETQILDQRQQAISVKPLTGCPCQTGQTQRQTPRLGRRNYQR
jgi:hypothetical protein